MKKILILALILCSCAIAFGQYKDVCPYVNLNSDYTCRVILVNPNTTAATVALKFYEYDGDGPATDTITLDPHEGFSFICTVRWIEGYFLIESDTPVYWTVMNNLTGTKYTIFYDGKTE